MPKKQLFRLFLCLLLLTPFAMGHSAPLTTEITVHEGGCNLPGPSNVHVVSVGSNTATIAWDAQSGAWGYKVYLSKNGNPPTASGTTTSTFMTFFNLAEGTYTATVHCMCSPIDESPQFSSIEFSTIVIEIVCDVSGGASQYTPITGSNNLFEYSWLPAGMESYYFYVSYGSNVAKYKFYRTIGSNSNFTVRPLSNNPAGFVLGRRFGDDGKIFCGDQGGPGLTSEFYVKYNNTIVTTGYFLQDNQLKFDMSLGYYVSVWRAQPFSPPLLPGQTDDDASVYSLPTPQPNPFGDELFLSGGAANLPTQCALLDGYGRVVRQFDYDPGTEGGGALTLPTADLPPGIYFLQLRSSAGSATHKLLKM